MLAVLPVVSRTPASGLAAHHQFHGIHGPPSSGDVPQQPSGFEPRGCVALGDRLHPHAVSNQVQRAPDQLSFFTHPQIVTSSWDGLRRAAPYAFTEQGVAMLSSEILRHSEAGHPDGAALAQEGVKLRILLLRAKVPSCRIKAPLQTNRQMAPPRYARQAKARGDYIWTPSQPRPASRSLARMDRFRSAKSSQDGRFLSKSRNREFGSSARQWSFRKTNSGCTSLKLARNSSARWTGRSGIRPRSPTLTPFSRD